MNKKTLTIILSSVAAVLVLAVAATLICFRFFQFQTSSASNPTITVQSKTAKKGQNVKVPVTFTGNPGVMAFILEFEYDNDSLAYINYEKSDSFSDYDENTKDGNIKMIIMNDEDVKKDGDIVTLNFKVKDDAKGTADIKVTCGENDVCNYNEEIISCKTVNGKITIQ